MLVLLPPSETKRVGGSGAPLDVRGLRFPELRAPREVVVRAVRDLAAEPEAMMRALKLGPRQAAEVDRNREVTTSPTMPAIDRYTGVLFDALDAPALDDAARAYAADRLVVHSALLGLVGALDAIPAYRLSHDSRLPGLTLKRHWREPVSETLAGHRGLIVDLRSEGYAELGPAPARADSVYLRVVAEGEDGRRRALNHFNKRTKGLFVRALLTQRPDLGHRDDLIAWSRAAGFALEPARGAEESPELELLAA